MCLPLNTACCERGFSTIKRVKSERRSSLSNETLDMLLQAHIEGVAVQDFQPGQAIAHWWNTSERVRRPALKDHLAIS